MYLFDTKVSDTYDHYNGHVVYCHYHDDNHAIVINNVKNLHHVDSRYFILTHISISYEIQSTIIISIKYSIWMINYHDLNDYVLQKIEKYHQIVLNPDLKTLIAFRS